MAHTALAVCQRRSSLIEDRVLVPSDALAAMHCTAESPMSNCAAGRQHFHCYDVNIAAAWLPQLGGVAGMPGQTAVCPTNLTLG